MRSTISLVSIILILCLVGIFVFQNDTSITISFFKWSQDIPSGLLALFALLIGLLIGTIWFLPRIIYYNFKLRGLMSKLNTTEKGLGEAQKNITEQTSTLKNLTQQTEESEKKEILMKEFLPK